MREIKFRAWDKGKKLFLPVDTFAILPEADQLFVMLKDFEDYREGEYGYENSFDLLQFTGLKDKNGKEIYEGDIIGGYEDDIFQVIYREEDAKFTWKRLAGKRNGEDTWHIILFSGEIIGNIYENPKLLQDNTKEKQ